MDENAHPEFWAAEDDPQAALYVHRMAASRKRPMRGLGGFMLNWASEQAAKTGKSRLRLDAWTNNPRLLRYYERQGYTLVRVVDLEHRQSGALFQRSV